MAVTKWKPRSGGAVTVTITLDSLANNAGALSSAISNTTDKDMFMDMELLINTYGTAPTDNSLVEIYVVREVDGTNYEDSSDEGRPRDGYVGGFIVDNQNASDQRLIKRRIEAPPADFKVRLINKTGQAFPASGNTLTIKFYSPETA